MNSLGNLSHLYQKRMIVKDILYNSIKETIFSQMA
jgi:hypothetical protein